QLHSQAELSCKIIGKNIILENYPMRMSPKTKPNLKVIPWWQPEVGTLEYSLVKQVFKSNFPNEGELTNKFEKKLASLLNVPYAIAVPNGTAALFLSLKALHIGYGDEVIVPDVSFISTANAVEMTGAKAILVDIDPVTLGMDPEAFEKAITKKTKAVIPVHVSGRPANIHEIIKIAKNKKIPVIEDAAEAFMSKYKNKCLGTFGDIGCFSFAPTKTITTGQGGLITVRNKEMFLEIKRLKDQGRPIRGSGGDDIHQGLGYNFKFTDIQAAIGLGQLSYLKKRIATMKRNYELYKKNLASVSGLQVHEFNTATGELPLWILVKTEKRDKLYDYLVKNNMHCRKFWHPIHSQSYYKSSDSRFPI